MKTVDIKGKSYVMVNERLKEFRSQHPNFALTTTIIELNAESCTFQAEIRDENNHIIAMGTAREERDDKSSMVNKTSFVENCETSAWGRALGNFGIGIDESIASADEVARAIAQQSRAASDMTLEDAKQRTTSKGKHYYELDNDQLQFIVDSDKSGDTSKKAAKMVLADRKANPDNEPITDEDVPF